MPAPITELAVGRCGRRWGIGWNATREMCEPESGVFAQSLVYRCARTARRAYAVVALLQTLVQGCPVATACGVRGGNVGVFDRTPLAEVVEDRPVAVLRSGVKGGTGQVEELQTRHREARALEGWQP
jgi:hypothetical protein